MQPPRCLAEGPDKARRQENEMRKHGRKSQIRNLFRKQRGKCYLCGGPMVLRLGFDETATRDHRIPQSRLTAHRVVDRHWYRPRLMAACHACNQAKGDMTELEYLAELQPLTPLPSPTHSS